MSFPEAVIERFLAAHGLGKARRAPLKSDASFRSYERVAAAKGSFILMKAPPDKEDTRPFAALSGYLCAKGFSAPKVLARDHEAGLLLLEDLGDDLYTTLLKRETKRETELYETAVDLLLALHALPPPAALPVGNGEVYPLKPYDGVLLNPELALFAGWYLPAMGVEGADTIQRELEKAFRPLLAETLRAPAVLTLRDYHADNQMWLKGREGTKRVGLLDFQDAVLGHPAYDLVSLLQDARRPYNADLEGRMLDRYLAGGGAARDEFRAAYQVLGAQRNLKIIGIF
ncbi:MAG TPA: phosphotransferase, partial [Sphingomonadales bacterium]|nr:phosphotransferase [Sphingomonadales bacterium]